MILSQLPYSNIADLFKDQPGYILLIGLLIVAITVICYRLINPYFETKKEQLKSDKMQKEIDEMKKDLETEKLLNRNLTNKIDQMRIDHAKEIAGLNERLLKISMDVITIKTEYEGRKG